jgi:Zn-dependent peptidase ImmA (M78 family)
MTQTLIRMNDLYSRLTSLGLPKIFVRKNLLPDWWDEEFEATDGAVLQAASYVSRRLNLDIDSLLESNGQPIQAIECKARFKTQRNQDLEKISLAYCLAARIAELVAYACKPSYQPIDGISVADIRHEILRTQSSVNLTGLLEFCWSRGIPILHFSEFPKTTGIQKFDGMVAFFYDHPVIILSHKSCFSAWQLFIAAHEVGHIYKKHLDNGAIVDSRIEPTNSDDNEETEANEVASELLLGNPDMIYTARHPFVSGEQLATSALAISKRDQVDPGVVTLNFAWSKANQARSEKEKGIAWATGTKALKMLEAKANAPAQINAYLHHHLDWEKLSDDNQEYLKSMLKL